MSGRRFAADFTFTIPPMEYRLVPGDKGPGDLELQWRPINGGWQPAVLDHVFLIVDYVADNENVLYPPPQKGGAIVREYVHDALKHGWVHARNRLHLDRARKAERWSA